MKYKCKENDVIIEKKEDEIWISVDGDTKCGKTVIGLKDLNQALILFGVSNHREQLNSFIDYVKKTNYIGTFEELAEELVNRYEKTI